MRSRDTMYHLMSAEFDRTVLSVAHDGGVDKISVYNLDTNFPITLGSALIEEDGYNTSKWYNVKAGHYLAAFKIDQKSTIRYNTDEVLPCFANSDYSDSKGIFQACKASDSSPPRSLKLPGNFPASRPKIYGDSLLQLADKTGTQALHKLDFYGKNLKKNEHL